MGERRVPGACCSASLTYLASPRSVRKLISEKGGQYLRNRLRLIHIYAHTPRTHVLRNTHMHTHTSSIHIPHTHMTRNTHTYTHFIHMCTKTHTQAHKPHIYVHRNIHTCTRTHTYLIYMCTGTHTPHTHVHRNTHMHPHTSYACAQEHHTHTTRVTCCTKLQTSA